MLAWHRIFDKMSASFPLFYFSPQSFGQEKTHFQLWIQNYTEEGDTNPREGYLIMGL